MSSNLNTPVLFLIFNRLDTTMQVFEAIRATCPPRLYIASDGPRGGCEGEKEKVENIRDYVLKSIDWNCEIKTLFREKNLGCGKAVSGAITWFFENEEMGIILEDDCLPSQSFFKYCEELLIKYKDDERIYHITGYNPLTCTNIKKDVSYYFARFHHCWGWASWRRAWQKYHYDIENLDDFIASKKLNMIFKRKIDRIYWYNIFRCMEKHEIDTWDYQWEYYILKNNGLCINPAKNMITNIGFGIDATHTIVEDGHNNQQRFEITRLVHPEEIAVDEHIANKISEEVFGISWLRYLKSKIINTLKKYLLLDRI